MKHIKYLIACLAMAAISHGALAQDAKIGVIDLRRALYDSDAAAVIQQELEAELAPDQERAAELSEQYNALLEEFQQNEAVMTEEDQRRINSNAQDLQVQLQLIQERVQATVSERDQQFVQSMQEQLGTAVNEVVAEGGFDLILNAASAPYFASVLDITARVTAKLNELAQNE